MSARGKALAALAALAAVILAAMASVGPAFSLDRLPWYTADEAMALLSALGPDGQARYLRNEVLDLGFIAVYSAFAFLATGALWEGTIPPRGLRAARALALLPGLLDLVETSLVISVLTGDPGAVPGKVAWLVRATPAKWASAAALVAFALAGAVNLSIVRIAARRKP